MKAAGIAAAVLLLVGALGTAAGYVHHRGYLAGEAATKADADRKVDEADGRARQAQADRLVAEAERDQLLDVFSRQKQDLLDMEAAAAAAVASRDNAQQQLERIAAQRKAAAKETAHVHAECSDLEHLPVCPAVAERLWGEGQDAPAAPRH